jgi:xanthine dehydrogenase accessory factor
MAEAVSPNTQSYDRTLETALAWHQAGKGAALATVVETWGSSPRPVGSLLAISGAAEIEGSVSGGCVEGAVVAEALDTLDTGTGKLLTYGVSDDDAFAVGLACGGTIRIQIEPIGTSGTGKTLSADLLGQIAAARAARRPIAYVVDTSTWERHLAGPEDFPDRFRSDRSGFEEDGQTFVAVYNPPLRMAVIGAVHIAQALMPMARLAGYDATLIDPRESFGASARFPGEKIVNDWPDEALAAHGLDARCAVVTLTHDSKLDDPAIQTALRSQAFYLGCLGSSRTHAKRVARLAEAGFTEAEMAKIHAPVGLDIGAKSPAEIAVSILGQITEVLRSR